MTAKHQLRKEIKQKTALLSEEEKFYCSKKVLAQLENLPTFQSAGVVLMYWSLPDEVDTHAFIEKWSKRKTILLPVVVGDDLVLKPYDGRNQLNVGSFNISEPISDEFDDVGSVDLCVVPGLAFDRQGNRLGRGKGYYDRFLSQMEAMKVGICFDFQLVDNVPCDVWDKKMDLVLSN